jgi:hypothetical protein
MNQLIVIPTNQAQPAQAGLAGGSPQIYLPGGPSTEYDAYLVTVHKVQYQTHNGPAPTAPTSAKEQDPTQPKIRKLTSQQARNLTSNF